MTGPICAGTADRSPRCIRSTWRCAARRRRERALTQRQVCEDPAASTGYLFANKNQDGDLAQTLGLDYRRSELHVCIGYARLLSVFFLKRDQAALFPGNAGRHAQHRYPVGHVSAQELQASNPRFRAGSEVCPCLSMLFPNPLSSQPLDENLLSNGDEHQSSSWHARVQHKCPADRARSPARSADTRPRSWPASPTPSARTTRAA